ncbi:MAG: sugar transferase, partial [Chloroflexota bacterium]|nr:sugar transferase [Chloroflexota bacterium]
MKRKARLLFVTSLVGMDAIMMGLAFYLAYYLRLLTEHEGIAPFPRYWGMMLIQIFSLLMVFFFYRLYHRQRASSYIDEFYSVFGATSVGIIVTIAFISFIFKNRLDYHRLMMIYAWILTVILVNAGRLIHTYLWKALRARGWGRNRVLIVGAGEVGRMLLQKIRHSPGLGYEAVGLVAQTRKVPLRTPILGTVEDLPSLIESQGVDEVIIGLPEASHQDMLTIISLCEREKVNIRVFPDVFQIMARGISIGDLDGMPLLTIGGGALRGWRLTLKRAMDLVGAAVGLVLFSPLMLLTALLVKLDSPGPVFYTQERMGLDAKPFMILKFRSMRRDAEAETGPVWAVKEDPRRTRLG